MKQDPLEVIEMKQALASTAELMGEYVTKLVAQGFSRDEAIQIAIAWHRTVAHMPIEESTE